MQLKRIEIELEAETVTEERRLGSCFEFGHEDEIKGHLLTLFQRAVLLDGYEVPAHQAHSWQHLTVVDDGVDARLVVSQQVRVLFIELVERRSSRKIEPSSLELVD